MSCSSRREQKEEKELKEAFRTSPSHSRMFLCSLSSNFPFYPLPLPPWQVSDRLADSPCVVVTSKYGWSANMERIMTSQALGDPNKQSYMKGKRVLEVNPRHPLIKQLKEMVANDPEVRRGGGGKGVRYVGGGSGKGL